jgi:hypothetical protein
MTSDDPKDQALELREAKAEAENQEREPYKGKRERQAPCGCYYAHWEVHDRDCDLLPKQNNQKMNPHTNPSNSDRLFRIILTQRIAEALIKIAYRLDKASDGAYDRLEKNLNFRDGYNGLDVISDKNFDGIIDAAEDKAREFLRALTVAVNESFEGGLKEASERSHKVKAASIRGRFIPFASAAALNTDPRNVAAGLFRLHPVIVLKGTHPPLTTA